MFWAIKIEKETKSDTVDYLADEFCFYRKSSWFVFVNLYIVIIATQKTKPNCCSKEYDNIEKY